MVWIPAVLMIAAIICIAAHGFLVLFGAEATPGRRTAGVLNLLLAISALTALFLFASGSLIISPEYSVLLAEGTGAWIWCLTTIVLIPFAVWMALHSVRVSQQRVSHIRVTLPLGAAIGLWTVIRASQINPAPHNAFTIYCADLWSCPLLVWIILCIVDWFFTALGTRDRVYRICGAAFVVSCFALGANEKHRGRFLFADPQTLKFWWVTAWICIPLALASLTWIALRRNGAWSNRAVQITASVVAGLLGLGSAVLVTCGQKPLKFGAVVWGVWGALLLIALIRRIGSSLRNGTSRVRGENWSRPDLLELTALVLLGGCIADLSHFAEFDPSWDLALLAMAWLVLQESAMGYPLFTALGKSAQGVAAGVTAMGGRLRPKVQADAAPKGSEARASWGLFWKSVAVVVVLIAVPEFFNAGKTIVEPFTKDLPVSDAWQDQKGGDLGNAVAQRMVNTLGLLRQELLPDLLIEKSSVPAAMDQTSASQTVVAGNSLQIPGTQISIPFGFIAAPIQLPLRKILRVTVIHGTVQKDGAGYALVAESSSGQSWRVDEDEATASETCPVGSKSPAGQTKSNQAKNGASAASVPAEKEIIGQLADGLAYRITSSDAELTQRGMTSEWTAIPDFREGLRARRLYDSTLNYDDLSRAIDCFRAAIDKDPDFALAWYRLGLALELDNQPGQAVDALRQSIRANSRFVAGYLALAQALYYYETYYDPPPPSLMGYPGVSAPSLPSESKYRQSAALLQTVLSGLKERASVTERAEAYVGLCRNELYYRTQDFMQELVQYDVRRGAPRLIEQYRQFFYCKRAEYLYSKLSPALRAESRVRPNEEWVVTADGMILAHSLDNLGYEATIPKEIWRCDDPLIPSSYLKFAARFYNDALTLDPNDAEAACGLAMVRASAWKADTRPLQALAHSATAHWVRASALAGKADDLYRNLTGDEVCQHNDKLQAKYDAALSDYLQAITLDPSNPDLLNEFAYQIYEWHLESARHPQLLAYPTAQQYADALAESAKASRLTATGGARIEHRLVESTVGELDLAMGDPSSAATVLRASLQSGDSDQSGIEHPQYDEIRWDLAQAYACMGPEWKDQAGRWLSKILEAEKGREDQRFVGPPDDGFVERNLYVLQENCRYFTKAQALPKTDPACSQQQVKTAIPINER